MSTTTRDPGDEDQSGFVSGAAEVDRPREGSEGLPPEQVAELSAAYFQHVASEDLAGRSDADLRGAFASHCELAASRPQGTVAARVSTPTVGEVGWSAAGRSVVEVVALDMPFLVDSLTMELGRQLRDVHVVVHPHFDVERDVVGTLRRIAVARGPRPPAGWIRESWMHVEIDRLHGTDRAAGQGAGQGAGHRAGHEDGRTGAETQAEQVVADIQRVLRDVVAAVEDWTKMHERVAAITGGLRAELDAGHGPRTGVLEAMELREGAELLDWLAQGHFTFLGYREYALEQVDGSAVLRALPGTGLGILRADPPAPAPLPEAVRAKAGEPRLLVLTKANSRATVHRPAYLDYVGVKTFDDARRVIGERRFLGLLASSAYTESLARIPLIRDKAAAVLRESGFDETSHAGKALMDTLETYPRDDLFHTPAAELGPLVAAAMQARERRAVRVFVRRDTYERYVSVLVYLPRDRYNTAVRERFAGLLAERLDPESVEFTVRIDASTTARVHFVVRLPPARRPPALDLADLERRFAEASRSWAEDFTAAVVAEYGEEVGATLARRYAAAFPEAYKEDFTPRVAAVDVGRLEGVAATLGYPASPASAISPARSDGPGGGAVDGPNSAAGREPAGAPGVDQQLYQDIDAAPGEARLKLYRIGAPLSLSRLLPLLSSFGVEVVDERPYSLAGHLDVDGRPCHVYDFGLRYPGALPEQARELFQDALRAAWRGLIEVDGFNRLVLGARLTWRQALVLRAYAKYMRQGNSPFALDSIETALGANAEMTRLLVQLFETRFDPDLFGERERVETDLVERIEAGLDDVGSLDHDRILRSYLTHLRASTRTNYFQYADPRSAPSAGGSTTASGGEPKAYLSIKLEPGAIGDLPQPRPRFEIFVYSPRVEGVHLRFGAVARGGLRWSDRRDDFRTEVLGLVKAQMVKNTVIVPVGAKGGFYAKALPDPAIDREAWSAEAVACYTTFICGLLDLTDNREGATTVGPARVVRRDGDDSYLVVAADKGTATFSDTANAIAARYGFWLGDAFASGGSVGYDHKAMGITAKGAWVSVQRHFRERGVDCQREDFTCVGIGDMSGDVFGNGMLRSEHIGLVAAFDHRDIFLDPVPDVATSYAERARLFALPRSSWADYDRSLISQGGGVFPRSAKTVPIHAAVRAALGLDADVVRLSPAELMRAILLAPVDLLWNGGIGTYVKASHESDAEAGDKANDAIRVDGRDLRVACVGEGGNLGLTQAGRVEFARSRRGSVGGHLDTDFIDNSAGVDTSDHEVNIKILLDRLVAAGALSARQRVEVLAEMTEEVSTLVLRDNYEQNLALANAEANATPLLHVHESWMKRLEADGFLDRELEGLPSSREVARRLERRQGLCTPELSVLLAWTKIVLAEELLASDLPEDPFLEVDLRAYFPSAIREGFPEAIPEHPLRREIIVTQVVNDLVNGAGISYWPRLAGETGVGVAELTRANFVAREIFGSLPLRQEIASHDNRLAASVQTRMRLEMRTLVERGSRWLATNRRPPLRSQELVDTFAGPVQALMAQLPDLLDQLGGRELDEFAARRDDLIERGSEVGLADRVAVLPAAYQLLNLVEIALRDGLEPIDVARIHLVLGERLGLPALVLRILRLPREDRWQTMARATLRDDLHAVHAQLTAQVMAGTDAGLAASARVALWEAATPGQADVVERAARTLREMCSDETIDLARMSVGLRIVRDLLA